MRSLGYFNEIHLPQKCQEGFTLGLVFDVKDDFAHRYRK